MKSRAKLNRPKGNRAEPEKLHCLYSDNPNPVRSSSDSHASGIIDATRTGDDFGLS
jgi:hypothetical protein